MSITVRKATNPRSLGGRCGAHTNQLGLDASRGKYLPVRGVLTWEAAYSGIAKRYRSSHRPSRGSQTRMSLTPSPQSFYQNASNFTIGTQNLTIHNGPSASRIGMSKLAQQHLPQSHLRTTHRSIRTATTHPRCESQPKSQGIAAGFELSTWHAEGHYREDCRMGKG